jgi:hypothetical protein
MRTDYVASPREEDARGTFREGLEQDMTQLPAIMTRIPAADGLGDAAEPSRSGEERAAMMDDLSLELYSLLRKYLVLREHSGGYSVGDEEDVETILRTLVRAGWTVTRSEHGELDGTPPGAVPSLPLHGRTGRTFERSAEDFQWSQDSVPVSPRHSEPRSPRPFDHPYNHPGASRR